MWFLEHESLLGEKRVWLRPGSQQLFGRTKQTDLNASEGKKIFIDNKNVSRKHMMLRVLDNEPENGTKLHSRSQIEVVDLSCRQGTIIDGERTLKSSKEADGSIAYDKTMLTGTEHTIRLSSTYPPFRIRWQDVVFTYASKEKKDNFKANNRNSQLHAIDIKTSSEFIHGRTTHVVSQKRNLPKVLEALVSGTPVVTTDHLDAIIGAASHSLDTDGNYVPSKLEEDFDAWWPQEKEYVPPAGAEPVPRPDQMLAPDSTRSDVFSGLTFVFLNETQYASLHPVIGNGGGKTLLFEMRLGETTVDEYVDYVKSVVGQKKRNKGNDGTLPVVTVRLSTYPDDMEDWVSNFMLGVDQALSQCSILQNEFLDAIITKDVSSFKRKPAEMMDIDSSIPTASRIQHSARRSTPSQAPDATQALPRASESSSVPLEGQSAKTNPRKRPLRRGVTSRFTGFDDYEPPSKVQRLDDMPMQDMQEASVEQEILSQSVAATQADQTTQSQGAPIADASEQMDQMFPAAAAIRRQRAATRPPTETTVAEAQVTSEKPKTRAFERIEQIQKEKKKAEKEVNVKEEVRKRVIEEDEKRRLEEENLREALAGIDISTIRAKIQIADMQLRRRHGLQDAQPQTESDRWNPEWDGRKNFKKFKRRGAERGVQSQKVLVALEEAPPRKGFGDAFYLEDTEPVRTKEDEQRLKRRIGRAAASDSEPETGFTGRKRTKPKEIINVEDSGPDMEVIPVGSGSTFGGTGRTQRVAETQLEDTQTRQPRSRKRGPISIAAGEPISKKTRHNRANDDSDEEETGFRFKRRG